ncbi:MAG: hypothetical protein LBV04_04115 [Deferribacteraceae bacterium]|jgi:hypothetical protein|nr:hypothetical protein [Deferribacteraceae bacterium]
MKLLAVFFIVSLALHSLLLLLSWPKDDVQLAVTVVEFTPVSKIAPSEPQPAVVTEPEPAIESETPTETSSADETSADDIEEAIGELDIVDEDDNPAPEENTEEADEPEPAEEPQEPVEEPEELPEPEEPIEEPTDEPIDEPIEEPVAEPVEETPTEPVEEPDRRVDVPVIATFVSDRISGEIEFKGKGRRPSRVPPAPDFKLSNNTSVKISFKVDAAGRPIDIIMPPLSPELERTLRAFVEQMRFSAVLYNEPDEATMTIDLKVR